MHRTALRVMTGLAALAVATASVVGTANADDRPIDARQWGLTSTLAQNEPLVLAIADARADLRTSTISARTAWRAAMQGIREQVLAEAATARVVTRADYRDAVEQAWARYRDQVDTATAAAKSTLLTARAVYAASVTGAFARYAPESTVPRGLLEPSWWVNAGEGLWTASPEVRQR